MQSTFVLNFAPTGGVASPRDNPLLPVDPARIVDEVLEADDLGITIAHIHVRNEERLQCLRSDLYASVIEGIRRHAPELVLCVSTSGRNGVGHAERAAPILELTGSVKPDMGSLTLSSLNFSRVASLNPPDTVRGLLAAMRTAGVVPELEAFDIGMLSVLRYLLRKGALRDPVYVNILLGNLAGAQADLLHAGLLLRELPDGALWSFGGIAAQQLTANALALAVGGGIRVGLEDNLHYDSGRTRLTSNSELIRRVLDLGKLHGRSPMSPAEFRQRMRMAPGNGQYGRAVPGEA